MRTQVFARLCKAGLLIVRLSAWPTANRFKISRAAYYWSHFCLEGYTEKEIYVLPSWFYKALKWVCNLVSNKNVVDKSTLRSVRLQAAVEWVIHLIPYKIRFSEMLEQDSPPGQRGRALTVHP